MCLLALLLDDGEEARGRQRRRPTRAWLPTRTCHRDSVPRRATQVWPRENQNSPPLARSVSMTESSLDPDRLGPTADPLSSLDPATARIAAMDAALPSWHLGPFWAAVALLALVLILAVLVWPLRRRIANSRVLRQFSAVRRVSSDPSIVRQPHLLPSVSAQSAHDHPLCLPRSLHPAHIDSNAHTRVRVHTTTTATRTHTHTASLSLSFSAGLFPVHTAPSLARARTSSRG